MTPSRRASASASWSMTGPRDVLTSTAVGFIAARVRTLIRCRVSAVRLTWSEMKSLRSSSSSRVTNLAPSGADDLVRHALDVVVQDRHPEPLGTPRHGLADPPEADDPERRSVDVRTQQQQRTPRPPLAVADVSIALRQPTCGRHQQRPGEIGGGLGQDARRVADRDPAPGAGRDIDVVEADRVVADHLQRRAGGIQQLVIDPVGQQGQDPVAPGHATEQLGARRRQLALPHVRARRPPEPRPALRRGSAGRRTTRGRPARRVPGGRRQPLSHEAGRRRSPGSGRAPRSGSLATWRS